MADLTDHLPKSKPKTDTSMDDNSHENMPTALIVLGMAGSGKTTFVQRLTADIAMRIQSPPYVINLDPAVAEVPYPCNIDIRDTIDYKKVMQEYNLGPNGAIMTSLNLFSTKFDQVCTILKSKTKQAHKYIVIDTPGQIEVFTWSASGAIISEAFAQMMPTIIVYVLDVSRCTSPTTFMSNMLYACSIMYKTKLPFFIVLNKTDIISADYAIEWMTDYESYQEALNDDTSYSSSLSRSLSLVLDEFYEDVKAIPFSSLLGTGILDLYDCIDEKRKEFFEEFLVEYEKLKSARQISKHNILNKSLKKLEPSEKPSDIVVNGMNEISGTLNSEQNEILSTNKEKELDDSFQRYLNLNSTNEKS